MINYSNFNKLSRCLTSYLDVSDGQVKMLTLTRNLTYYLIYVAMSRNQVRILVDNLSGKHFNSTSCKVIRNQR